MKDGQTKVQFIRFRNSLVGTIAAKRIGNTVQVAFSSVGAKSEDRFTKNIGKNIALGRLEKNRGFTVAIAEEASEIEIKREVYKGILDNTRFLDPELLTEYVQGISTQARNAVRKMYNAALLPK